MNQVKLGIIGTGIAARELHLPALLKLRDKFKIVAVCNHTPHKAREFSELAGNVPYVLDYFDILRNPLVEAVDIVLPIHLNYQAVKDALEAGKHVMVEKPLAANIKDAETMTTFGDRYRQVMMVAENYRYNPVFGRLKEMIQDGVIGEPYSVFWSQFTVTDINNKYAKTKWRIDHQYPGGFVTDAGVHNIAVLRDLFGEIKCGIAFNRCVNPEIGKMDSMSFSFVFESGVNGVFNIYFSAQGLNEGQLMILGRNGTLVVRENKIILKQQNKPDEEETIETDRGYQGQFEDFYECIVNGKHPISNFQKAYKDFKTIVSAIDSAKNWEKLELQ
jgi:predicted dehydrogenase